MRALSESEFKAEWTDRSTGERVSYRTDSEPDFIRLAVATCVEGLGIDAAVKVMEQDEGWCRIELHLPSDLDDETWRDVVDYVGSALDETGWYQCRDCGGNEDGSLVWWIVKHQGGNPYI